MPNSERPARRVRVIALFIDAATLVVPYTVAVPVLLLFLLIRTEWGALDPGYGDVAVAAAVGGAIVPAWTAWQMSRLYMIGATYGQERSGLVVVGIAPRVRCLRLLLHPLGLPAWLWCTATLLLGPVFPLSVIPATMAIIILMFIAPSSALAFAVGRGSRGLHDIVLKSDVRSVRAPVSVEKGS